MSEFKPYRRKQIAELRPVTDADVVRFRNHGVLHIQDEPFDYKVSITDNDLHNGSPKIGDMIARNQKENKDQWLIAEQYFNDNFKTLS